MVFLSHILPVSAETSLPHSSTSEHLNYDCRAQAATKRYFLRGVDRSPAEMPSAQRCNPHHLTPELQRTR
jgi:hypothetical protein